MIGEFEVIQGQLCDHCDSREPSQSHQAEYAVDGTERWWQSPPLSRGLQYNEVNLTISLGQVRQSSTVVSLFGILHITRIPNIIILYCIEQRHAETRKPCCRKDNRAMRPMYG